MPSHPQIGHARLWFARALKRFSQRREHPNENLTIHLKVKDFNAWRTGYDARELFCSQNDPNDVVILQDYSKGKRKTP